MNKKDVSNFGNDIKKIVNDSLNDKPLETAFIEVNKAIKSIQMDNKKIHKKVPPPIIIKNMSKNKKVLKKNNQPKFFFPHAPIGKVKATLLTVFGSIGIGTFAFLVLILGAMGINPWLLGGLIIGLISGVVMDMRGSLIRGRLKRYKRYLNLFQGKDSCSIKEIASYSNSSERYTVKDLRKMISIGMFPQGRIDNDKTIIMLNNNRYERFLMEKEEMRLKELEVSDAKRRLSASGNMELISTIEDGRYFVVQVNQAKAGIIDNQVAKKVHRMEDVIDKIVNYIEGHPKQLSEVRRFMQYYLPTTLKLLNAYTEFEKQPIQGENITTAKKEINEALDTINEAFENLFDSLFASDMMDVSTDISVLETMLAQEGLTEKEFDLTNNQGGEN